MAQVAPHIPAPDLFHIQTCWRKPWLVGNLIRHSEETASELKDAAVACRVGGTGPHFWIICASDTAFADPVNRAAELGANLTEQCLGKLPAHSPDKAGLVSVLTTVHEGLSQRAKACSRPLAQLGINLTFLLLTGPRLAGANIGDNSVLAFTEKDRLTHERILLPLCVAMQPESGENQGLAHPQWRENLGFSHKTISPMHALIVATRHAGSFFAQNDTNSAAMFNQAEIEAFEQQLLKFGPRKIASHLAEYAYRNRNERQNSGLIIAQRTDRKVFTTQPAFSTGG